MTEVANAVPPAAGASSRPARSLASRSFLPLYGISILLGLGIWALVSTQLSSFVLASPQAVMQRLWEMTASGELLVAFGHSVQHMLLGFAIALVIAFPLGFLMGRVTFIHDLLDPIVSLIYAVPSVAWAPFIMIWFGLYFEARVALVVIMCLFDMLIVIDAGLRNADRKLLDVGRAFGATAWQRTRLILIPESLPFVFAALRIGAVRAVNAMITAELFLATVNLGSLMKNAAARFDSAGVLGVLFLLCVLGLMLQELLLWIERRACTWQRRV